jgi:hypothetical protein
MSDDPTTVWVCPRGCPDDAPPGVGFRGQYYCAYCHRNLIERPNDTTVPPSPPSPRQGAAPPSAPGYHP